MTTAASQETTSRRWVLPFLAALVAVLATILSSATASAATTPGAETRVRASQSVAEDIARPPDDIRAGQRLGEVVAGPQIVVATGVAANAGPRALPASVKVPLGNSKYGLEHILRRHSFNSLTTKPASKFSRGMGHIEIRQAINDAVARGGTWRVEGSSRVLDTGLGRTIGTDLAGNPTSGIRVVTDETGSVITSYPIPWP